MFSKRFIQKVKDATNLRELIEEYTKLTKSGAHRWIGRCPHPDHKDSDPSFVYYENGNGGTGSFMCFGCNDVYAKSGSDSFIGSDSISFIRWIKHLNFYAAIEFLAKRAGIPLEETKEDDKWGLVYQRNKSYANRCHQNLLPPAKEYLYSRGLEDKDLELWNIGFAPFEESIGTVSRIIIPLVDKQHRVIAFCNRAINHTGYGVKYKNSHNSEIFQKKAYLFGHQFLKKSPYIHITEGQFDVILAHKYGLKNVVATLGSHLSEEQLMFIKKNLYTPVFIYDGDEAGKNGIMSAVKMCRAQKMYSKVCVLPKDKDLANLAVELKTNLPLWVEQHTVPCWEYALTDTLKRYEAGLQKLREDILPLLQDASTGLTFEEHILMKSFVKERFNIQL